VAGSQSPAAWRREGFPTGGWVEPKPDGDATGQDPYDDGPAILSACSQNGFFL